MRKIVVLTVSDSISLSLQVQHLQQSLQNSQQQEAILRTELQHQCDQVADLTKDHNALLTKFRELTVLMSEAHNKLNTAVVQSGKAMAKDQSKVCSSMSSSILFYDTLGAEEVVCLCIGPYVPDRLAPGEVMPPALVTGRYSLLLTQQAFLAPRNIMHPVSNTGRLS